MGLFAQKNTGKDVTVTIQTGGGLIVISPLIRFHPRQITTKLESRPLNGPNLVDELPDLWEGDFEWDRDNVAYDSFVADTELGYFGGTGQIKATIDQLVTEVSGAQSQFQYIGVALGDYDAGDWRKEMFVKCAAKFRASQRIQVS